jgi:hypothetical protein
MVARETNLVNAFETTLAAQLASGGTSINLSADPGVDAPVYLVIDPDNDSNREVVLEDGDGTEVTINPAVASGVYTAREVKFVEGGGIDINWTDTDNGTDGDPYDLTFTVEVTASEIAAGTLVTESEGISSNDNDTTLPTSAAVKDFVDTTIAAQGFADIGLIIALG